jgi:tetratricopeptide (TPR) repeat protein
MADSLRRQLRMLLFGLWPVIAIAGVPHDVSAQQARQPGNPPQVQQDQAAACFTATGSAAIVAACDVLLRGDRTRYSADQLGFALQRRGAARAALGQLDEAVADFRQMVSSGYRVHEAHASIGSVEFRRQKLAEAETSYRAALRINAGYPLALVGLGHTLTALGRASEAVAQFDRALAIDTNDTAAHLGKGNALVATGNLDGAIQSFDAALRLDNRLLPALYERSLANFIKGDMPKALADADTALGLATGEERIRALFHRGRVRNGARQFDGGLADCTEADAEAKRTALRDAPFRGAVLVCIGLARQGRGEFAEATQSYRRALEWHPSDVTAYNGRGFVAFQQGRHDAAIADFEVALRLDPRSQDALRFLGLVLSDRGDQVRAQQAFDRGIELYARDPWLYLLRSVSWARAEDRVRAFADIDKAASFTAEQTADGFLVRGAVHYLFEELDQATSNFERAVQLNGQNGQAHRLLSRVLLRRGRLDEAATSLERARGLLPNDSIVQFQSGLLALARRDHATAVQDLTQSLSNNRAYAEPYVARGQAHEALGQSALALTDYREALAKIAVEPDARRALTVARERIVVIERAAVPQGTAISERGRQESASGQSSSGRPEGGSFYCRLMEGMFVPSRKYTGVEFNTGCGAGR